MGAIASSIEEGPQAGSLLASNNLSDLTNVPAAWTSLGLGTAAGHETTDFSLTTSALTTGILKSTTSTGALTIASAGDFPTLNQNTSGSAATLTTPRAINGVNFDGSAAITVAAAASTLTGTTLASNVVTSSLSTFNNHLVMGGSAPAIAAGAGAGTSPTVSIVGRDNGGVITIATGTLPTGAGATVATITFTSAFPTNCSVTLTPANGLAAALSGIAAVFAVGSASTFAVTAGTTALAAGTTYVFNYVVTGW